MGELIASKDVANNKDVAKYLVQWAADNNKFGTYCGSACGAVSNVTWNALTTPSAVTGSVNAFTALCENSIAMTEVLKNKKCKQAIWGNLSICDAIIRKSNNAISILRGIGVNGSFNAEDYGVTTGKFFVNYVTVGNRDYFTARITYAPGGEQEDVKEIGYGEKKSILRFATRLEAVDITGMNFNYVDFS